MLSMSTSAVAMWAATVRTVAIMLGVLEPDSNLIFDFSCYSFSFYKWE